MYSTSICNSIVNVFCPTNPMKVECPPIAVEHPSSDFTVASDECLERTWGLPSGQSIDTGHSVGLVIYYVYMSVAHIIAWVYIAVLGRLQRDGHIADDAVHTKQGIHFLHAITYKKIVVKSLYINKDQYITFWCQLNMLWKDH